MLIFFLLVVLSQILKENLIHLNHYVIQDYILLDQLFSLFSLPLTFPFPFPYYFQNCYHHHHIFFYHSSSCHYNYHFFDYRYQYHHHHHSYYCFPCFPCFPKYFLFCPYLRSHLILICYPTATQRHHYCHHYLFSYLRLCQCFQCYLDQYQYQYQTVAKTLCLY